MLKMMRKLFAGGIVTGALLVGLVAQAGSYLLAPPDPEGTPMDSPVDTQLAYTESGPHPVGVRRLGDDQAPIPMTYWYPGIEDTTRSTTSYSYALNMFGADNVTALATYGGQAKPGLTANETDGPYPLVILSHGFAITPSSYAWLAEHLASYGFVVVSPHHEESLDPGMLWRSTIERPRDIETTIAFVDDATDLAGLVDIDTLAVVGHSHGGYTALATAGARIDPTALDDSCDLAYRVDDPLVFLCDALLPRFDDMARIANIDDPEDIWPALFHTNVDAVVSIAGDAAMFGKSGLAEIASPVMLIGGTADTDSPFEWATQLAYDNVSSQKKVEIALEGAGHMIFAGGCDSVRRILNLVSLGFCSDPAWDRQTAHQLVESFVAAFLVAELQGDQRANDALAEPVDGPAGLAYRSEGY